MSLCKCETEEDYLRWQLAHLQESYRRDAQPIIDRLSKIEALKQPKPLMFVLTPEIEARWARSECWPKFESE